MLVRLFIMVAVTVGCTLAIYRIQTIWRLFAFVTLFLISIFLLSLPYFTSDPSTWVHTYLTGILQFGVVALLLHVAPAVIACYGIKYIIKRWSSGSRQ